MNKRLILAGVQVGYLGHHATGRIITRKSSRNVDDNYVKVITQREWSLRCMKNQITEESCPSIHIPPASLIPYPTPLKKTYPPQKSTEYNVTIQNLHLRLDLNKSYVCFTKNQNFNESCASVVISTLYRIFLFLVQLYELSNRRISRKIEMGLSQYHFRVSLIYHVIHARFSCT